jgi:diguanylate cyclase (GGDEF)-like protein
LILVVEDSPVQATVLKHLLRNRGFAVQVAVDGRKGLEAARELQPALVISDVEMPHMDGYTLCQAIKNDDELCRIPVMLLTTLSAPEHLLRALHAHADYYLTKPYNETYLLSRVEGLLRHPADGGDPHEITLDGEHYTIGPDIDRHRVLKLLLCTYENAMQQNRELVVMQRDLQILNQQLREQAKQLEALATQDGLTGLKNHRAFKERLYEEASRAFRYGQPLSLLLIDIDSFKSYNDSFGHPAGDEVLKQVAPLLEQCQRNSDFVARYGGEEFVVLLPNTTGEDALPLAERLREVIAAAPFPNRAMTISGGVATLTAATPHTDATLIRREADDLLAQADDALYASKRAGRNRVTRAS